MAEEALTWADCLSQAENNNPELLSATEAIKQTEFAKSITASGLYPSVEASLSASTAGTSATSSQTGITTKSTADSYSYGVSGSQLIFDGFKTSNDIKSAS
jgi:outer membrane protein TolC